jgi:hypothetical protein
VVAGFFWSVGQVLELPVQNSAASHTPFSPRHWVVAGRKEQVPALPARLQASHEPSQAELQHTPSTHLPLAHWLSPPQVAPSVLRSWHAPLAQYWPLEHCESLVQVMEQEGEVPLHT